MIAKLIKRTRIRPVTNLFYHPNLTPFCTTQSHVEQYKNLLIQLNLPTLKHELQIMKNISPIYSKKLKKKQIIDHLCQMQSNIIQQRLKQLEGKSYFEIISQKAIPITIDTSQKSQTLNQTNKNEQSTQPQDPKYLMKQINKDKVIRKSLQLVLDPKLLYFIRGQKTLQTKIMTIQYKDYLRKLKQSHNQFKNTQKNEQNITTPSEQEQPYKLIPQNNPSLDERQILKLKRKSFINLFFKTNDQVLIEEKKRKYLYEEQKSSIIEKIITSNQRPAYQEYMKNIMQIKAQKIQNQPMKGFYLNHEKKRSKLVFEQRKDKVLSTFTGFNHFKQMCTNPYFIRFLSALGFQKDIPLEFTMIKIAEESQLAPQTFKRNINAISQGYFLKMMRISTNYLQKVFKRSQTSGNKGQVKTSLFQDKRYEKGEEDDKYDEFDEEDDELYNTQHKRKNKNKKEQQTQKLPASREFIDMQLMQFALLTFEASIQRVIRQIMRQKEVQVSSTTKATKRKQGQQKQIKIIQETLQLSFEIFKIIESLFTAIEINDFNDLDKIIQILSKYHHLRQQLQANLPILEQFMHKHDSQFQEKLQLGLIKMVTVKQLDKKNFILKFQARKLNFDIIDNISSMLKLDNMEITLENKRDRILKVMERFLQVYVQNDMVEFLEEELVYIMVRFLEKQVYLDRKVRGLYEARVNFEQVGNLEPYRHQNQQSQPVEKDNRQQQNHQPEKKSSQLFLEPAPPSSFQWSEPIPTASPIQASSISDFAPFLSQKTKKSYYYMGQISQILSQKLLHYLISLIKYKHERKDIVVAEATNFNLIQEWYSEPTSVRLKFLNDQILQRYKRMLSQQKKQKSK